MKIAVLSDTHMPGRARALPLTAMRIIESCELILHAGDVVSMELLAELGAIAPLHAAFGNCDLAEVRAWGALDEVQFDTGGVRIAMVHDSGPSAGRPARLAKRFPDANVVVFGHSHMPLVEHGLHGMLLLNPGSPTDRRRAPKHTMAVLDLGDGSPRAEVVVVD